MTTQPPLTAEALRQLADLWEEYKRRQADRHSGGKYRGGQHADFDDVLRDEAKRAARLTSPAPSPAGGGIAGRCKWCDAPPPNHKSGCAVAPASPATAGEGTQALRQRLMMFYQVNTTDELIAIQDRHIELLQAKLRQHSDEPLAMPRVREG